MKKVSLMIAALALVLGTSQCSKEDKPLQNGEKQHIVLTANNGNDGSKVAGQFVTDELDLKWENGDVITVGGGATGTLNLVDGAESTSATFEGDIEKVSEAPITFTVGAEPNYLSQTGADSFITDNICLVGASEYKEDGNYTVNMKLPYAVLKLDLSYFAGMDVEIKVQDEPIAKVTDVTSASTEMFVAIPTDGTEKTYVFNDDVEKTWTLAPNVFYTKSGSDTGEAIVIEPDAPAPATPKFTVDANGTTVEFAPGNLYWDGSAFRFEEDQWDYSVGEWDEEHYCYNWVPNHVSHFKWSNEANAVTGDANYSGDLFCASNFTVTGDSHTWRTLTNDELDYLLNSRTNASSLRAWVTLTEVSVSGLVILPDGSSATASGITTPSTLADAGAVFLPAAGYRFGTGVSFVGSDGDYWSGTLLEGNEIFACNMYFNSSYVSVGDGFHRGSGHAVRLVR